MLSPYRVLDLTDHRGQMAGYLLAALGAEVIAVEPPGGSPARRRPPLSPDGSVSLEWWAYSRGKSSIVVADHAELAELAADADVLIESADPGTGPVYAELAARNPALVHVTITAFGSTGPKAAWPADDLTLCAAGCQMALTGDADRAPVRTTTPQAWLHAGSEAACGALLALAQRAKSGLGQHVDVSAQEAVMQAGIPGVLLVPNDNPPFGRVAGGISYGRFIVQFVYPAADGSVSITMLFGDTIGPFTARLMAWVAEAGYCDAALAATDWVTFGTRLFVDPEAPAVLERAKAAIGALTADRTRAELFAEAQRRRLLLAPVATPADLVANPQLHARGYWDRITDPQLGEVVAPGPFAKLSATPLRPLGPPPQLGAGPAPARAPKVPAAAPGASASRAEELPLAGLRVVDLTWVYAGPLSTRVLADYGATVVKVEGPNRPDASRGGGGALRGDLGPEGSVQFSHFNAGKLGIAVDLTNPAGRGVLTDLARWADVLIESYTPGVMDAWGLGYTDLRAHNDQLIVVSTSLMGHSGPLSSFAGFGNLAGAITGFYELTGWPDRSPAGPFLAYTDYLAPRLTVATVLAALDWRRRHGGGQHIDFSQAEAAIHFLATAVLEHTVVGHDASRLGNADRFAVPVGVYPCRGEDRWLAVSCQSDAQWAALADELGRTDLSELSGAERLARRDELDVLVTDWCGGHDETTAEAKLVARGVAAHRVQNSGECWADPQLQHRGRYLTVPHPVHDQVVIEASRVQLSRTQGRPTRGGPTLGEHNAAVLGGLLGYDAERIAELVVAGALG